MRKSATLRVSILIGLAVIGWAYAEAITPGEDCNVQGPINSNGVVDEGVNLKRSMQILVNLGLSASGETGIQAANLYMRTSNGAIPLSPSMKATGADFISPSAGTPVHYLLAAATTSLDSRNSVSSEETPAGSRNLANQDDPEGEFYQSLENGESGVRAYRETRKREAAEPIRVPAAVPLLGVALFCLAILKKRLGS